MKFYVRHYANGEVRMDWYTFCTLPAHKLMPGITSRTNRKPKARRRKRGMKVREFV